MDNLANYPVTMALGKASLVAGTTTTITTTGTLAYTIKSKAYTRAALTNSATPTVDYADGLAFTPLLPGRYLDVPLFWQYWRIESAVLSELTAAVRATAAASLR